jgi:hypothetical protein
MFWSWIAAALTLGSQYLITKKLWIGFVLSMMGNVIWFFIIPDWGMRTVQIAFLFINAWGIYRWKVKKKE